MAKRKSHNQKYSVRELTAQLKLVAMECEDINADGELVTNAERLARTIWKKALGYVEQSEDATGKPRHKTYPAAAWAIQLLLERLEGRVANTTEDGADRITVAEKVGELAVDMVNSVTADAISRPAPPPPFPKGGD